MRTINKFYNIESSRCLYKNERIFDRILGEEADIKEIFIDSKHEPMFYIVSKKNYSFRKIWDLKQITTVIEEKDVTL
ncbi:MAG: hypothetical protein MOGMAGMI_00276 [Candidatus Omnitrophica bacterium]|nr:hypothetical protein [Candidatus Omnitrophota bacterium]